VRIEKRTPRSSTVPARRRHSRQDWPDQAQIEETTSDYDREKLQERLAKLAGGVAIIRGRRRHRSEVKSARIVDDAITPPGPQSRKASVAGGGSALLYATKSARPAKARE